ncbi:MAG TPA: Hsp70 family protein [Verrucomicrobia bacterium]|nr:MAG: molecular chaperone DnaK [Lentisphaerae bacterium GWF2_57_35]HBA85675.1 Hsp70 family protein [Verrucomicrobiota bacterium]
MTAKYAIGIDLGTTNSSLAYTELGAEHPNIQVLPIPQLVEAGTVEARTMLPSFIYIGLKEEEEKGAFALPWGSKPYAVGEWARRQSADVPTRTIAGAKSWLAYSRVDRHQPILPWNAPEDVQKISPVEASRRYVEHMIAAWTAAFPDAPIQQQQVVLCVPASFDAAARELTHEAAIQAGLPDSLVLLEEPQAAIYAWLAEHEKNWRKRVNEGDILLVCDVGGGTTDLTLAQVNQENGELSLQRLAVGNHILVGGDNMDLALAHVAQTAFAEKGTNLDPWQSVSLWHACRTAKEVLLGTEGKDRYPVAILGRGRKVIGGSISMDMHKDEVSTLLTDGFFPACRFDEKPVRRAASGFKQLGLPFESDPGITRHLAFFLQQHGGVQPTHVLFNGGVFKAGFFRERVLESLGSWFGADRQPKILEGNTDFDLAVARGAAYYGTVKQGRGIRIRGGIGRSYYVGMETAGPAIPGAIRPLQCLCVAPMGMEEGAELDVPSEEIGLIVGEEAHFRFFSSSVRKDAPGVLLPKWKEEEVGETDSLKTALPAAKGAEGDYVPVRFHTKVTELGSLELWCVSTVSDDRWKLEFSVRENE